MAGPLGRREPTDWVHLDKYPISAAPVGVETVGVSGVLGLDWYTNFDHPQLDGTTRWIGRGSLGSVRGGHCICAKAYHVDDLMTWYDYYDQGAEGACVGFGVSRMQSLNNRRRYAARDLYLRAQLQDEFADTPPEEGTSVRAGLEVARTQGLERVYRDQTYPWNPDEGINAYRWATQGVDEVRRTLGLPDSYDGVPLLNSWGRDYPHIVRITDDALDYLLAHGGEFAIVTDR